MNSFTFHLEIVPRQLVDDRPAQFERIDRAHFRVHDLAARLHHQRERQRPLPLDAERIGERVGIVLVEDVVGRRRMLLIQELERGIAVFRRVGRNGDQLEVAVAIHAVASSPTPETPSRTAHSASPRC